MKLINCRTLQLEEVLSHEGRKYAILSHTWTDGEEVQYKEFEDQRTSQKKPGWWKIAKTCQLALQHGCDFAWVDTCCIDKSSSAELTEAINSMFTWYAHSSICFAYLADYDASDANAVLGQSRWFSRGWTLQELIAPAQLCFYDKAWNVIGMKHSLDESLSSITGIQQDVLVLARQGVPPILHHLDLQEKLSQVPIARKMAWAAKRKTTREEDIAYCLLGIFGVNLPLLYGEGHKAFIRLQEEIIKHSNDLSLLAWRTRNPHHNCSGVLATHPAFFYRSETLVLNNDSKFSPDFTMTNKGLHIKTRLKYSRTKDLHFLLLNCHQPDGPEFSGTLCISLKNLGGSVFCRAEPHDFSTPPDGKVFADEASIFLSKSLAYDVNQSVYKVHRNSFVFKGLKSAIYHVVSTSPELLWDSGKQVFITTGLKTFIGCHELAVSPSERGKCHTGYVMEHTKFLLLFGVGRGQEPWVSIDSAAHHDLYSDVKRGRFQSAMSLASKSTELIVAQYLTRYRVRCALGTVLVDGEPVYEISLSATKY